MINIQKHILFSLFLLITSGSLLLGQRKDFRSWFELEVDKGFENGAALSFELEQRFDHNALHYDRMLATLAGEYDLTGYFELGGGVRALMASDYLSGLHPRYRIHADATGSHQLSEVDLSLRIRFQYGFEEMLYFNDFSENVFINRSRIKAAYHLFGTKVGVFASVEPWGLFGSANGRFFKRVRYAAGASYDLSFKSELSLRYILEDEFNQVDPLQSHILVFGYSYSL